ncbi:Uncharacterised protein [Shigella sonnei]|nr:Uncharacterised protein [Shigella sonnei]CSP95185.1 Uncharacterised protein [Shigella sonnei]
MDIAPFFGQKTTLEQQFNNPGTGCFCPQTIGRTKDLFQIFVLHKARDPGHRRKQCCIGKMARRLGLPLYHFTFFTQQLIAFRHHRQWRTVVFFIALFAA